VFPFAGLFVEERNGKIAKISKNREKNREKISFW
jgi:hypothetical protein